MAESRRGYYPTHAEDLQTGLLVLTLVELFVSKEQRCKADIKILSRQPDASHRRFLPPRCELSHQEQSFQHQDVGLADSVGLRCGHLGAEVPKRSAPDCAICMHVGPRSTVIVLRRFA